MGSNEGEGDSNDRSIVSPPGFFWSAVPDKPGIFTGSVVDDRDFFVFGGGGGEHRLIVSPFTDAMVEENYWPIDLLLGIFGFESNGFDACGSSSFMAGLVV